VSPQNPCSKWTHSREAVTARLIIAEAAATRLVSPQREQERRCEVLGRDCAKWPAANRLSPLPEGSFLAFDPPEGGCFSSILNPQFSIPQFLNSSIPQFLNSSIPQFLNSSIPQFLNSSIAIQRTATKIPKESPEGEDGSVWITNEPMLGFEMRSSQ
jgi:hypothetical protein